MTNNRLTSCIHLIIPFILTSFICSAQSFKYTTQSKSAISHYEKGLHAYDLKQNVAAVDELILAIRKDTSFIEAYILLASVYEDLNQPQEAVHQYIKSFELQPDFFTANYTRCANLEIRLGQYNAALLHYSKYLTYPGITVEKRKLIEKNIADCNFALEAIYTLTKVFRIKWSRMFNSFNRKITVSNIFFN